jgi:hypothetical protein
MKTSLFTVLGLAALAMSVSVGCTAGGADDEGSGEESGEDALTQRQLPGVVAVEIAEVHSQTTVRSSKTVGAPKRVKAIVTSVKKLRPTDPVPRCLQQDTTRLTFLGENGKKVATVGTYCGGFGHITFENGNEGYGVKLSGGAVDDARNAPFAVGDALWGITKIELSKPGSQDKRTLTGTSMKPILDGFDLDEVPDAHASFPRCLPSHAITLKRGDKNVAFSSFICGSVDAAHAPASVKGSFTAVDPAGRPDSPPLANGAIKIDPRPVIAAFAATR